MSVSSTKRHVAIACFFSFPLESSELSISSANSHEHSIKVGNMTCSIGLERNFSVVPTLCTLLTPQRYPYLDPCSE